MGTSLTLQLASMIKSSNVMTHSRNLSTECSSMPASLRNTRSLGNLPICISLFCFSFSISIRYICYSKSVEPVNLYIYWVTSKLV